MNCGINTPTQRSRQLRLFSVENPLNSRLGAEFFRRLPAKPGVYFFYDATGGLLYIGQSNDLRARVGSYRHVTPEKHPKRTLRLVHRIARVEWEECLTPAEAQERERVLLLEKRPPFNRAGVWPGYPWWLSVARGEGMLEVRLSRHAIPGGSCIGPLPSSFRHVLGSLLRCTHRLLHPERCFGDYPPGLLNFAAPLQLRLRAKNAARAASSLIDFAHGNGHSYLEELHTIVLDARPLELEFWTAELETLLRFTVKAKHLPISLLSFPVAAPLPLFPNL